MSDSALPVGLRPPISEIKAELFRALAHPARIRVLEVLAEGERSVGEMQPLVGHRVVAPVPAARGAAPGRARHDPQGGLVGRLRDPRPAGSSSCSRSRSGCSINSLAETEDLLADLRTLTRGGRRRSTTAGHERPRRRGRIAGRRGRAGRPTAAAAARRLRRAATIVARRRGRRRHRRRRRAAARAGVRHHDGLGATAGLMTAIVAGLVAAVFGGSNVQVSGPTGAMTVVLVPIVARYGARRRLRSSAHGRGARGRRVARCALGRLPRVHPVAGDRGLHRRHRGDHLPAAGPARARGRQKPRARTPAVGRRPRGRSTRSRPRRRRARSPRGRSSSPS